MTNFGAARIALIFGDLAVDVRYRLDGSTRMGDLDAGTNVAVYSPFKMVAAGTALNFADAIRRQSQAIPLILGAVGNDLFGDWLLSECGRLFDVRGIFRASTAPTSVIIVSHKPDGTRLMMQPVRSANSYLSEEQSAPLLAGTPGVALLWVSGYAIAEPDPPRVQAVRAAVEWAREHRIPVLVDLVPHAFRDRVGDLDEVRRRIGEVAGFVAEVDTVRELSFATGYAWRPRLSSMTELAEMMSEEKYIVFLQHRLTPDEYAQVAVFPEFGVLQTTLDVRTRQVRAIGDQLVVHGLIESGLFGREVGDPVAPVCSSRWIATA